MSASALKIVISRIASLQPAFRHSQMECDVLMACGFTARRLDSGYFREFDPGTSRWCALPEVLTNLDHAERFAERILGEAVWWKVSKGQTRRNEPMFGAEIWSTGPATSRPLMQAETNASAAAALTMAALKLKLARQSR